MQDYDSLFDYDHDGILDRKEQMFRDEFIDSSSSSSGYGYGSSSSSSGYGYGSRYSSGSYNMIGSRFSWEKWILVIYIVEILTYSLIEGLDKDPYCSIDLHRFILSNMPIYKEKLVIFAAIVIPIIIVIIIGNKYKKKHRYRYY